MLNVIKRFVDVLKIKDEELQLVDNVHALEPNYLREC